MLLQVFTFVLITHHALGPCCCAPIGYIGNSHEVRRDLGGMWTHSSSDFRKVPLGLLKRLFESKNGEGGKNEQEDIIQIPDDMFVTCKGCQPTKEVCSKTSPCVTEKYSATTIYVMTSRDRRHAKSLLGSPVVTVGVRCAKDYFYQGQAHAKMVADHQIGHDEAEVHHCTGTERSYQEVRQNDHKVCEPMDVYAESPSTSLTGDSDVGIEITGPEH